MPMIQRVRDLTPSILCATLGLAILVINLTGNYPPNVRIPTSTGLVLLVASWLFWLNKYCSFGRIRVLKGWVESFAIALVCVCVLQTTTLRLFYIPSGSMEQTLKKGDFVIGDRLCFGWRVPYTRSGRIGGWTKPKRGDVVIFRSPMDLSGYWVKRIVGLPGDVVAVHGGIAVVNEEPERDPYVYLKGQSTEMGGVSIIQDMKPRKLGATEYWVMGDNRNGSFDSRYWGPLNADLIEAKVRGVYWSWGEEGVRWGRLGRLGTSRPEKIGIEVAQTAH